MEEKKIKISELLQLEAELNGVQAQDGTVLFKGLLSEKLSLVGKYWMNQLASTVTSEATKIKDLRVELIKKYGVEENGNISIPEFLDEKKKKRNPNLDLFQKEYTDLLAEEKSIQYDPIPLKYLESLEVADNYTQFFKFIKP
jgi:hypothetical protein